MTQKEAQKLPAERTRKLGSEMGRQSDGSVGKTAVVVGAPDRGIGARGLAVRSPPDAKEIP